MKYEYTCRYEDSVLYINKIIMQLVKKNGGFINFLNIDEIFSTDTKQEFKKLAENFLANGYLEIWFNPLVVDLAKELLLNGKVEKGYEIKETLQLLQDEDEAWEVFPEGGNAGFIRSYLNPLASYNPYTDNLEGIPYEPAGGRFGTVLGNLLQNSYDDGTLLKYPINEILLEGMGKKIEFRPIKTNWSQEMDGTFWRLYSQEKNWYYGAGWAVFKIPLQHPSKPFMNWDESPLEAK